MKKAISLFLALAMICTVLPSLTLSAKAADFTFGDAAKDALSFDSNGNVIEDDDSARLFSTVFHQGTVTFNFSQLVQAHGELSTYCEVPGSSGTIEQHYNVCNGVITVTSDCPLPFVLSSASCATESNYAITLLFRVCENQYDDRFGGSGVEFTTYTEGRSYNVHDDVYYTFAGWYSGVDGTGTKLTAEASENCLCYAKWTKSGRTVRTQTLDL